MSLGAAGIASISGCQKAISDKTSTDTQSVNTTSETSGSVTTTSRRGNDEFNISGIDFPTIGYEGRLLARTEEDSNSIRIVSSQSDAEGLEFRDEEWVWRGNDLTTADLEQFVEETEFTKEYILIVHRQVSGSDARMLIRDVDRMTESHVRLYITVTQGTLTNRPVKNLLVRIPVGGVPAPESAIVYFSTPHGDDVVES